MDTTTITLTTEHIKLDALLKAAGVADSGGQAKQLILAGSVRVNDETALQRGKKLRSGDVVVVSSDTPIRIVIA